MEILGITFSVGDQLLLGCAGIATAWLVVHGLAAQRDRNNRLALASSAFRAAIYAAAAPIPQPADHWGSEATSVILAACQSIGLAVADFAPHLNHRRSSFETEWKALKKHCEEVIPQSQSAANRLYWATSGGPKPTVAKERFHAHVKNLLAFAKDA